MNPKLDIFDNRAESHAASSMTDPLVRRLERDRVLQRLDLREGQTVCDFQAAGGYLGRGMLDSQAKIELISIEPHPSLAMKITNPGKILVSPLSCVDMPSESLDRIGCLAGLHHEANPLKPIAEIFRLLKSGGKAVVAEVELQSPTAKWLNGFVHQHTIDGHDGQFIEFGELKAEFIKAGFHDVQETREKVPWHFHSYAHLAQFFRSIFGLVQVSDSQIIEAAHGYFDIQSSAGGIELGWSLIYCSGVK